MSNYGATQISKDEIRDFENKLDSLLKNNTMVEWKSIEPMLHITGKVNLYSNNRVMRVTDRLYARCRSQYCINNPQKCKQELFNYTIENYMIDSQKYSVWTPNYDILLQKNDSFGVKCANSKMNRPLITAARNLTYDTNFMPSIKIHYLDTIEEIYSMGKKKGTIFVTESLVCKFFGVNFVLILYLFCVNFVLILY